MNKLFRPIVLIAGLLMGTAVPTNIFTAMVDFAGAPTGGCFADTFGQNDITGDLYTCVSGNWIQVSGGLINVVGYGVKADGVTDDTTAMQNAFNVACLTQPTISTTLVLPKFSSIKITSGLTCSNAAGFTLDGQQTQGQGTVKSAGGAGAGNAIIMWYGSAGGTMLTLNQVRDSTIKNLTFFTNASNYHAVGANTAILIDEIAPVTSITTNSKFEDIFVYDGNPANANFIGIDICPTAPGNCEQQNFDRINIQCGGATATTSNAGTGIQLGPGGQPFDTHMREINTVNCSRGIDIENGNNIEIDGGLTEANYTDFYANGGRGLVYRNVRSELGTAQVVVGSGCPSLVTVENDSFAGLTASTTTIGYASSVCGTALRVIHNDWDNIAVNTIVAPSSGNSAGLDSQDNNYPAAGTCPNWGQFGHGSTSFMDVGCLDANGLYQFLFDRIIHVNAGGTAGVTPQPTTVGALPNAATNTGMIATVNDSTSVGTEGQTCVGNSNNVALAFSNGSVWKCF